MPTNKCKCKMCDLQMNSKVVSHSRVVIPEDVFTNVSIVIEYNTDSSADIAAYCGIYESIKIDKSGLHCFDQNNTFVGLCEHPDSSNHQQNQNFVTPFSAGVTKLNQC